MLTRRIGDRRSEGWNTSDSSLDSRFTRNNVSQTDQTLLFELGVCPNESSSLTNTSCMFEFHGWLSVSLEVEEGSFIKINDERRNSVIKSVRAAMNEAHDEFSAFDVIHSGNGAVILIAHGLRNHRYEPAIALFRHIATTLPKSYGLLYVRDDEDPQHENEFVVYRAAHGRFEPTGDKLLSPCVPIIENPEGD